MASDIYDFRIQTSVATGAAAKVINFDRLVKKVRPGTVGNIKTMSTGVPHKVPVPKT